MVAEGDVTGLPLFDYPQTPGYRRTDTSKAAAEDIAPKAETLRQMCIRELFHRGLTADECADILGVDKLAIRPRFSELLKMERITDSGIRRQNASGKSAIVWRLKI